MLPFVEVCPENNFVLVKTCATCWRWRAFVRAGSRHSERRFIADFGSVAVFVAKANGDVSSTG